MSRKIQEQVLINKNMNMDMSNPERRLEYLYQETGKEKIESRVTIINSRQYASKLLFVS